MVEPGAVSEDVADVKPANGTGPLIDTADTMVGKKEDYENGIQEAGGDVKEKEESKNVKTGQDDDVKEGKESIKEAREEGDGGKMEEEDVKENKDAKRKEKEEKSEGGPKEDGEDRKLEEGGELKEDNEMEEVEEKDKEGKGNKGSKKRQRGRKVVEKVKTKKTEEEGQKKGEVKKNEEGEEKKRETKKKEAVNNKKTKGLSTPVAFSIDRPVRERKSVERLVASIEKESVKEFLIEKGKGTLLKDIPNVVYKLSKRKTDDTLKMLHTILFGRRGKAFHIKNNISQFSGFVWHNNEEKQRAKVKEKLDKCVKDKLLEFCDVLDIPVVKTAARKEDLVVKLLDFMVAPYATTDVLLAEKDQSNNAKRQRRTGSRSGSKRSRGTPAKRSATKRRKIDTPNSKEKESAPETEDENEEEEEEDNENGIPDEDEDGTPVPSEMEEKEDEPEEGDDNDSGSGSHGSKKSSKKGFSTKTAKGSDSEEEDGEDKGKGKQGPKRSAKGKSASKVEKGSEPEEEDDEDTGKGKQGSKRSKGQSAKVKKGSDSEKEDDEVTGKGKQRSKRSTKGHSVAEVVKRSESEEEDDEAVEDKRGSMKSTKRSYAGKFYTKKAKTQKLALATTPPKSSTRISNNRTKAGDSSDSSPRVFSQKKNEDRAPKKSSTLSKTASKARPGKNVAKGRDKPRKKESGPSEEDLRNEICEILKEVDFNTATFTDILKQLARRFDTDLTPRKAVIKIMIQEELTKLADEEEENEDDGDAGNEENPESVGVEA
eukprot:TRINITY_DN1874_c0_g1_i2.p1 TRINITY_DN1874_c0_g1~~TRINITY_DN1874_c0_g1_i2.p1  ORF type:complete len:767 (-),score=281.32 TRINITY_DN1874_c0_g1_i2:358-2658(-)